MKITIENYRGFDIEFDTDYELFQCICAEEDVKESKSFSAVKKFIDDYKKENQGFKPFDVFPNPNSWSKKKQIKIIGVRKDGRFIGQEQNGKKIQIPDYELGDYILYQKENEQHLKNLDFIDDLSKRQTQENNLAKKEIISEMKIVTLKDFKNSL